MTPVFSVYGYPLSLVFIEIRLETPQAQMKNYWVGNFVLWITFLNFIAEGEPVLYIRSKFSQYYKDFFTYAMQN